MTAVAEATLDLTIGDSIPLSGALADVRSARPEGGGHRGRPKITGAIEEVGADHTVEIVHEDNCGGDDQQCAVQAARKLVDSDGATCIARRVGVGRHDSDGRVGRDPRGESC